MAAEQLPILFLIDDDPQVLNSIRRDVRKEFQKQYRIVTSGDPHEGLEMVRELKKEQAVIALFLSDQRMPGMLGVDFLREARTLYPDSKRALLTAYSDIDAAVRAINEVQLDYYFTKPWDPPEERLYPVLHDLLDVWQAGYRPVDASQPRLIGYQWSPKSHRIKDYLSSNLIPYRWLDVQTPEGREQLALFGLAEAELPVMILDGQTVLRDPSNAEIARHLGASQDAGQELYDVAIIGAGPAGLAAAVYGASEGLRTLLIERHAAGGQAGTSSKIENYLGFPVGLSGSELTHRAVAQVKRFGAQLMSPSEVTSIRLLGAYKVITLSDGQSVTARSLVITTGVEYRKLDSEGLERFTGAGVYYGAANTEAYACKDQPVFVVGGGNSAGQAAMHLSKYASRVHIVIRREGLEATMSSYLIDQIRATPNIELVPYSVVTAALGEGRLECITLEHLQTGDRQTVPASALFIFIGAKPATGWMALDLIKNDGGYLITGRDLYQHAGFRQIWKLDREPYPLETCIPGIFAAGDVRAGAMNRVASAVGEGSMSISFVHKYLAEV
jgi:thioredoxin reductase (NADPH)